MKKHRLAFIDVETTGLDPERHEIIELGGVVARPVPRAGRGPSLEVVEEFSFKIKPAHPEHADPEALRINGYSEADWLFAPSLTEVLKQVSGKISDAILVAQNVTFDWSFLNQAFRSTNLPNPMHYHKLDLISIAFAKLYDRDPNQKFSLWALAELFQIKNTRAHTALADAQTAFAIYRKLLDV